MSSSAAAPMWFVPRLLRVAAVLVVTLGGSRLAVAQGTPARAAADDPAADAGDRPGAPGRRHDRAGGTCRIGPGARRA